VEQQLPIGPAGIVRRPAQVGVAGPDEELDKDDAGAVHVVMNGLLVPLCSVRRDAAVEKARMPSFLGGHGHSRPSEEDSNAACPWEPNTATAAMRTPTTARTIDLLAHTG
jgi:hypothetical protein